MASGAHYPNGISTRTLAAANSAAGAGDLECLDCFVAGTSSVANLVASGDITAADGSVFGARTTYAAIGSSTTIVTASLLYNSNALCIAPFDCIAEIVYFQAATASITVSVRVCAGSVSTAAAVTTLTVGSATNITVQTAFTTIGATVLGQGSFMHITSAVQVTVNTNLITVNLIPVAT